jgi:hypothetical protein
MGPGWDDSVPERHCQPIAAKELKTDIVAHRYPYFLPDGSHFLY